MATEPLAPHRLADDKAHNAAKPQSPNRGTPFAWLPIPALLIAIAVSYFTGPSASYPFVRGLVACNFILLTLVSFLVAHLIARSFLLQGTPAMLALGCGAVVWGASAMAAALAEYDMNAMVTIQNFGAFLTGLCHLAGSVMFLRGARPLRAPALWLPAAYAVALSSVAFVTALAIDGLTPTFFVQGQGGTTVHEVTLGTSVVMLAVSAILLGARGRRPDLRFFHWYSLALGSLSAGLVGVMLPSFTDTLLHWLGRGGLYLGGVYMAVAALVAVRESGLHNIPLELALRESEERFKALAAATFEGIAVIEVGKFTDANEQLLDMLGYRREEFLGLDVTAVIPPADRTRILASINCGRESHVELEMIRKDGSLLVVEARGRTVEYQGRRLRFTAIRDITERKSAQARLEEAKQTLDALMEYVPEGITIADASTGSIRMVSRYGRETLGTPHEGLTPGVVISNRTVFRSDGVTPMTEAELPLSRAMNQGETVKDAELIQTNAQGKRLWLACNAAPIRNVQGRITGAIVAWRDVTARKNMEELLRRSEERYRSLFDGMTEGFAIHEILCDDHGEPCDYRFLDINAAFERFTGLKRQDVIGKTVKQVLPDNEPEWISIYGNVALTGEPVRFDKFSAALQRHYEVFAYRPAPRQFAVIFLDITARKQAEQQLQEAQARLRAHADQLEKTVARRTAKLQEAVAELEHLSYAIAHDMRAPLRAIQGFAELLQDECADSTHPDAQEYLRRIRVAAARMDQLITDSLNYSKAARQELTLEPVDLGQLLNGIVETYPNLQPTKADIQLAPDLPVVLGNEAALTQCFSNLFDNAVKFAKPGALPRIRVWAEDTGETPFGHAVSGGSPARLRRSVRVWVEDDGIGIPKESQERIFGIFQRATTSHEGTGIGLAIVRKVAQRMGGAVGVRSELGQGSQFWVELARAS